MSDQPALNIPAPVVLVCVLLLGLHAFGTWGLDFDSLVAWYDKLAFLGFDASRPWTSLSYALLHGGWLHVWLNVLWLVAFGSPVARRLTGRNFMTFLTVCVVIAAFTHAACYGFSTAPGLIGASGGVAGVMGAACRFALGFHGEKRGQAWLSTRPRLTLRQTIAHRPALGLILFWVGMNLAIALFEAFAQESGIGWQAHLGGFFAGLVLFSFFDPVDHRRGAGNSLP